MEFHSRLAISADRRFLLDAGWFWHPWCGACVFDLSMSFASGSEISEDVVFSTSNYEIDSAAFLGNNHLVVSSVSEGSAEALEPDALRPKQLGVWSLLKRCWETKGGAEIAKCAVTREYTLDAVVRRGREPTAV